jgi:hypothetical protein
MLRILILLTAMLSVSFTQDSEIPLPPRGDNSQMNMDAWKKIRDEQNENRRIYKIPNNGDKLFNFDMKDATFLNEINSQQISNITQEMDSMKKNFRTFEKKIDDLYLYIKAQRSDDNVKTKTNPVITSSVLHSLIWAIAFMFITFLISNKTR